MFSNGVAGMLGRPDLASTYGYYMAGPVAGTGPALGAVGAPMISGSLSTSVSGDVGTGQMSLGMAATLIIVLLALYYGTRGMQH